MERRADFVKKMIVAQGELLRLQVLCQYLNQYIGLIKNGASLIPAELAYTLDETGLSN
jgi:hypothetical protein